MLPHEQTNSSRADPPCSCKLNAVPTLQKYKKVDKILNNRRVLKMQNCSTCGGHFQLATIFQLPVLPQPTYTVSLWHCYDTVTVAPSVTPSITYGPVPTQRTYSDAM